MAVTPAVVKLTTPEGRVDQVGSGNAEGIMPEGLSLTATEQGPDTATFTLRRDPRVIWDDLQPANQMDIEVNGVRVWGGRVDKASGSGRDKDQQISVTARGWQDHLGDDQILKKWVHTRVADYQDQRVINPAADLTIHMVAPQVNIGGAINLKNPTGFVVAAGNFVSATFDAGAALFKRAVVTWSVLGGLDANNTLYSRASSALNDVSAGDDSSVVLNTAAGTISQTFSVARRYHHVFHYRNAAPGTFGADTGAVISSAQLFSEVAYESGGASVLKASDVVKDILASGALPLLDTTTSQIDTTATNIPEFSPDGYKTPLELIQAINAYHDYRYGVDAQKRLFFKARPTNPKFQVGEFSGDPFSDAAIANLSDLYNKVYIDAIAADGSPVLRSVVATSGILNRQGLTRASRLPVSASLTSAAADAIGAVWLTSKSVSPLSGSIVVKAGGDLRFIEGGTCHPSVLLLNVGERIRLMDRTDPNLGAVGRDATIIGVTYNADDESATVSLDNNTNRLETFLSRLAAVQGAG